LAADCLKIRFPSGSVGSIPTFGIVRSVLPWLWSSRLTWRATVPLTAALCLIIVATAGIGGTPGTTVLIGSVVVWLLLLSRMADNEARHVLAVAHTQGRTPPARRVRRLLFPWWARATVALGVVAATVAAAWTLDSDWPVALTLALGLAIAWLLERGVISLRAPRA